MRPNASRVLGRGSVLPALRADLRRATKRVDVIGPWIDGWTAEQLVAATPAAVALRVLTRPLSGCDSSFTSHAEDARAVFAERGAEVRELSALHAKAIVVDDTIAYVGSANWYRYSLEESFELVIRTAVDALEDVADQIEPLWERAVAVTAPRSPRNPDVLQGQRVEVIDPTAAAVLRSVAGSFVLRRRR